MEIIGIKLMAVFVFLAITIIAFISYSQENEELVGGSIANFLVDNKDTESKKRMELQAQKWIEQMSIAKPMPSFEKGKFPVGGTFSDNEDLIPISRKSVIPNLNGNSASIDFIDDPIRSCETGNEITLISKLSNFNIRLRDILEAKMIEDEREQEFNNDCA